MRSQIQCRNEPLEHREHEVRAGGATAAAPVRAATDRRSTWHSPSTILGGLLVGVALGSSSAGCGGDHRGGSLSLVVLGWTFYRNQSGAAAETGNYWRAILVAAALAPVKAMDEVLQQPIQLPARRMRLAELEVATGSGSSFRYDQGGGSSVGIWMRSIQRRLWSSPPRVPVGEFIEALEGQTSLRHHFAHCGNAYSVLRGNHASTMVSFRKPQARVAAHNHLSLHGARR